MYKISNFIGYVGQPPLLNALTFIASGGASILKLAKSSSPDTNTFYTKKNDGDWQTYTPGTEISLANGDKVSFSGITSGFSKSTAYYYFSGCANCVVTGDINSLVSYNQLKNDHFNYLFNQSKIIDASNLRLSYDSLMSGCYRGMFSGCTNLKTPPNLPATVLNKLCYQYMFAGCTALTSIPALPVSSLTERCYKGMFKGCTNISTAVIGATNIKFTDSMSEMFSGCTKLSSVEVKFTDFGGNNNNTIYDSGNNNYTKNWLANVSLIGLFICSPLLNLPTYEYNSGIYLRCSHTMPLGWVFGGPLTIGSVSNGQLMVGVNSSSKTFKYKRNNGSWNTLQPWYTYELLAGDNFYIKSDDNYGLNNVGIVNIGITGTNIKMGGKLNSLINYSNTLQNSMFRSLFALSQVTDASRLTLPSSNPPPSCYQNFFANCAKLSAAPSFPNTITDVGAGAFISSYFNCHALSTAPAILPATGLAADCYNSMFDRCHLTGAPILPATTVYTRSYANMFHHCTGLIAPPVALQSVTPSLLSRIPNRGYFEVVSGDYLVFGDTTKGVGYQKYNKPTISASYFDASLPATTLASSCYRNMFSRCRHMIKAPVLPAKKAEPFCYDSMFYDCEAISSITSSNIQLLSTNIGCCRRMFMNCTSLTSTPELTGYDMWSWAYASMFQYCTGLTVAGSLINSGDIARKIIYDNWDGYDWTEGGLAYEDILTYSNYRSSQFNQHNLNNRATHLHLSSCLATYSHMFADCTSLKTPPSTIRTVFGNHVAVGQCNCMFSGTAITSLPTFNSNSLGAGDPYTFSETFRGCSGLTSALMKIAALSGDSCCLRMFYDCDNLTYIDISNLEYQYILSSTGAYGHNQITNMFSNRIHQHVGTMKIKNNYITEDQARAMIYDTNSRNWTITT